MPKVAKELTALAVSKLTKPGTHAVGGCPGLYLNVSDNGARSWVLRIKTGGKRRELGLGSYNAVPLAEAREAARTRRKAIQAGADPREQSRANTDSALARLASRYGVTKREMLDRLIWEADNTVIKTLKAGTPELDAYLKG